MTAPVVIQSIQATDNSNLNTGGIQSHGVSQAFSSPNTAGNAIVNFATQSDYAGVHTDNVCSDSNGNTYQSTPLDQESTNASGGAASVVSFTAANIAAGSNTVSNGFSAGNDVEDYWAAFSIEVGNVSATPLVGHSGNTQNGLAHGTNNLVSGSITVQSSDCPCILIAIACNTSNNSGGTNTPTPGTGMTGTVANTWGFQTTQYVACVAYRNITTAGTYQAVFNQVGSAAEDCTVNAVILRGSSGGGGSAALAGAATVNQAATSNITMGPQVLAGAATGTIASLGSLSTRGILPGGVAGGVASATGNLKVGASLRGAALATTSVAGSAFPTVISPGYGSSVAGATGSLTTGVTLAGSGTALVSSGNANITTGSVSGLNFGLEAAAHASASVLSVSTTPGITQLIGSGFVVGIISRQGSSGNAVPSDNMGNTYQQIGTYQSYEFGNATASLWYCPNGTGGNSHTFTATQTGAADISVFVQEITNTNLTGVILDQAGANYANSSPYNSNAITTGVAQELLLSFFGGFSNINPATLTSSLPLQATLVNGGVTTEVVGGFAGQIVSTNLTGFTASFTQAGNTYDAVTFLTSFYAAPGVGTFTAAQATAPVIANANLSTTAFFTAPATSGVGATGTLINLTSVTLLSNIASVTGSAIGSVYDPYFWEDQQPYIGCVLQYDPTLIVVYPDGQVISTQNNVSAYMGFVDPQGNYASGLFVMTTGEAAYAGSSCSASGFLTTIPGGLGSQGASSTSSASGSLTTGVNLTMTASSIESATADLTAGISVVGVALSLAVCIPPYLGNAAQFNAIPTALFSASGAMYLQQTFAAPARGVASASGVLSHGAQLAGGATAVSKDTGALSSQVRFTAGASSLGAARGSLTIGARFQGQARTIAQARGSQGGKITLLGASSGAVSKALANLGTGAGLRGAAGVTASGGGNLRIGAIFRAAASALVAGIGTIVRQGAQLQGAALSVIYSDPELTTNQNPVGMYNGNPNYMVGISRYQQPIFNVFGPTQADVLTFDYSEDLSVGETLTGVVIVTVTNTAGNDPTPTDILNGLPSFNVGQTQVLVPVNAANGLVDNDYYLIVRCPTTNPQKILDRFGLLQIRS